jgi:hypothetical protein
LYAIRCLLIGVHNTLYSDLHSFRQCQTAITCFYMVRDGLSLRYKTPMMGPPWPSAVFEFPIYQWLVVEVTRLLGQPLEAAGRMVSIVFFLLTLIPLYRVLAALGIARPHRAVFLSLLAASPYYIFWSRTFMIESTAVFFCAAYAACVVLYCWRRSRGEGQRSASYLIVLAVIFGSLGAMVKVTTFPSFGLATVLYVYRDHFAWPVRRPDWRAMGRQTVFLMITGGIPVLFAMGWTHFADALKDANPIAYHMASRTPMMITWNFGTTRQKLSPVVWSTILANARSMLLNYHAVLWLAFIAAAIVTRRRWKEALACVVLFLIAPLLFTNLHVTHEYYMYANGIFLLCAVGFCILGILESPKGAVAGIAAMLVTLTLAVGTYFHRYYPLQKRDNTSLAKATEMIDSRIDPHSVIICNMEWDPIIPYTLQRRAVMIPGWTVLTDDDIRNEFRQLHGYKIGGLFMGNSPKARPVQSILEMMNSQGLQVSDFYSVELHNGVWNVSHLDAPPKSSIGK